MNKVIISIILSTFFLTGCGQQKADDKTIIQEKMKDMQKIIVAHWRNDTTKTDYIFSDYENKKLLTKLTENNSSECTYEFNRSDNEKRSIEIWFKCPQPDWSGYAELHQFEFLQDYKSFVDTMYIQGIANRINGEFININEK